jgi:Icc-related predicted phosphoesterase
MPSFRVASDLHLEHREALEVDLLVSELTADPEEDALVLAGDVVSLKMLLENSKRGRLAVESMRRLCDAYPRTVWVFGNHEFYGSDASREDALQAAADEAVGRESLSILNPGTVEVAGVAVVGATMWFRDAHKNKEFEGCLADFRLIKNYKPWVYLRNQQHLAYIRERLAACDPARTLVVTHHLPSVASVPPRFAYDETNRFFVCDVEDVICDYRPAAWVHGHTHSTCDYRVGATRVVCNPRGYPNERDASFDQRRVVRVG